MSHSAGTLLAFQYLRAHGDRVRELVMDGALPHKNGERYFDAEYAAMWTNLADDARRFAEREAVAVELGKARLQANLEPRRMAGEMSEGMLVRHRLR